MNRVIILNKPFLGGWLKNDGNIAHEIIDFFKSDNGKIYAYNNPWGHCPDDIYVGEKIKPSELNKAEYLVLTSGFNKTKRELKVLYVLKLKQKLHRMHYSKTPSAKHIQAVKEKIVNKIIVKNEIKYHKKYINDIYNNDESLYLTFEVDKIYQAKLPILFEMKHYNFQRNKGYLYENIENVDFNRLNTKILNWIQNNELIEIHPKSLSESESLIKPHNCFIEMLGVESNELAYSSMLFHLLNYKPFLNLFIKELVKLNLDVNSLKVSKEKTVEHGRMDLSIENDNTRIVVENKVYSGLNGVDFEKNISQLRNYYDWTKSAENSKRFILTPDSRKNEIIADIKKYDKDMLDKFEFLTYGDICKILDKAKNEKIFEQSFKYLDFLDEIIESFRKYSYKNSLDIYASMFLNATISKK